MSDREAHRRSPVLIAHVVYRLGVGGLENGLVNLINRLPPERFRHAVICLTEATDFRLRIARADTEIIELRKRPGHDWSAHWRLYRVLRRLRPHIVHTRNLATLDCQLAAWCARVPVRVHGEHGWDTMDLYGTSRKYRLLRRAVGRLVHEFIAMSRHLERWLTEVVGIERGKVTQIYNGVDLERFAPPPRGEPAAAARRGQGAVVIGTVGRLEAVKDPATLVEAFIELKRHCDRDVSLRVVGDGSLRGALEQQARAAGVAELCQFVGASGDVARELQEIDVFALTSLNEGISNTILEAMAMGVPVVATDVGGNAELVVPGVTGELVPARDPRAFAEVLQRYAMDPDRRRRHGAAGRQRVSSTFALEGMAARYAELYDSLFRVTGPRPGHI